MQALIFYYVAGVNLFRAKFTARSNGPFHHCNLPKMQSGLQGRLCLGLQRLCYV